MPATTRMIVRLCASLFLTLSVLAAGSVGGELEERLPVRRPGGRRAGAAEWVWTTMVLGVPVDVAVKVKDSRDPPRAVNGNSVDYGPAVATFEVRKLEGRAAALDIAIRGSGEEPFTLKSLTIKAHPPVRGIHRQFVATSPFHNRADWSSFMWDLEQTSLAGVGIPMIQGYSRDGTNAFLFGFVDQTRDTRIRHDSNHAQPGDRINTNDFTLRRPAGGWASITTKEYRETVYFSLAEKPYYEVVRNYVAFTDRVNRPVIAKIPPAALDPVWCSWYAFRSAVDQETILANARVAKELGIGTILIDAGWWSLEGSDDPAFPLGKLVFKAEKFPEFPEMVRKIQAMDLKVMVWTAPIFFSGGRDRGPLGKLKAITAQGTFDRYLCPRVAEVASIAAAPVADVVAKYGLDGVKIDFMDIGPAQCFSKAHQHDYDTVGEGMDRVFRTVYEAVTAVKSDALIEFRTNYANVNNRQYATCYRTNDAPYDYDQIHREAALLKHWCDPIPPHADYAYWPPDESLENKIRFLAAISYGCVPTFSLDLPNISVEEKHLIAAWLAFYREHRDVLVLGRFSPLSFDAHFSVSKIVGPQKAFFGLFGELVPGSLDVAAEADKVIYLINGGNQTQWSTTLRGLSGTLEITQTDHLHRPLGPPRISESAGKLHLDLDVPIGGIVRVQRK